MIGIIGTPHWDDLVALAALVVVVALLIKLGCRGIDLAIDAMRRTNRRDFARHAEDARRLAATGQEPDWQGKTPAPGYLPIHVIEPATQQPDDNPARYAAGGPISSRPGLLLAAEHGCDFVLPMRGELPEKPAETSQPRHARVEPDDTPTGLMAPIGEEPPVVDNKEAMAAVAAVSGQDGAT